MVEPRDHQSFYNRSSLEKDKSARPIEESSDFYNLSSLSPETGGYGEKVGMDDEK